MTTRQARSQNAYKCLGVLLFVSTMLAFGHGMILWFYILLGATTGIAVIVNRNKSEDEKKADEALDLLGLRSYKNKFVGILVSLAWLTLFLGSIILTGYADSRYTFLHGNDYGKLLMWISALSLALTLLLKWRRPRDFLLGHGLHRPSLRPGLPGNPRSAVALGSNHRCLHRFAIQAARFGHDRICPHRRSRIDVVPLDLARDIARRCTASGLAAAGRATAPGSRRRGR